jgi:hypothetical protein
VLIIAREANFLENSVMVQGLLPFFKICWSFIDVSLLFFIFCHIFI